MDSRTRIVRAIADTILESAAADPGFADRLLANPAGTLEPLGVSPAFAMEAAAEYAEMNGLGEVSGYAAPVCKMSCCFSPKTFKKTME